MTLTVLNPNFDAFLAASNTSDFATLTRSVVMDFTANRGLANTAIVPVDGTVTFYLGLPALVTTHVIADVAGYFKPPGAPIGTVSNIATGTGLTGGPITTTGTISIATGGVGTVQMGDGSVTKPKLAASGGTSGQVLATDGSNLLWQTTGGGGGTVTSVGTGAGLSGGPITTAGTISVATGGITNSLLANSAVDVSKLNTVSTDARYFKVGGNSFGVGVALGTNDNNSLSLQVFTQPTLRLTYAFDGSNESPNLVGGSFVNSVTAGVVGATIAGGGDNANPPFPNQVTASFGTVGGGLGNSAGFTATVAGGQQNTAGNAASVGGGESNTASGNAASVGGGVLNNASGAEDTVGGGYANTSSGVDSSTVGGGFHNSASENYSTIAGGQHNSANAPNSTIACGQHNSANAPNSTIAGGQNNFAGGANSTIAGGQSNGAVGDSSTVAGGASNVAYGVASFAAGTLADAEDNGEFVWADNRQFVFEPSSINSPGPALGWTDPTNTFNVRATGGAWFVTAITADSHGYPSNGVSVQPNSGTWAATSDRNVKEDFRPTDPQEVLAKVAQMPIETWRYIGERAGVRHLGPVSQDFRAAFGLGYDDKTITTVDADGVALAAIQGLHQMMQQKDREIAQLKRKLEAIEARLGLN